MLPELSPSSPFPTIDGLTDDIHLLHNNDMTNLAHDLWLPLPKHGELSPCSPSAPQAADAALDITVKSQVSDAADWRGGTPPFPATHTAHTAVPTAYEIALSPVAATYAAPIGPTPRSDRRASKAAS